MDTEDYVKTNAIDWAITRAGGYLVTDFDYKEFEVELKRRGYLIVPDPDYDPTPE